MVTHLYTSISEFISRSRSRDKRVSPTASIDKAVTRGGAMAVCVAVERGLNYLAKLKVTTTPLKATPISRQGRLRRLVV